MQNTIMGWDIGGAHVKAALLNQAGEVLRVVQQPCPLWKGLAYLEQAIQAVLRILPEPCDRHAVTMTGELVDCFSGREQGVAAIIRTLQDQLGVVNMLIFAGGKGFIDANQVKQNHYLAIASANWIASAQLTAKLRERALFVDIGSTTSDILLIENHTLQALGDSDYTRLVSGELIYTGIVRTAVMAVARQAEFNGRNMGLMAEYFATMADVYRVTGDLNEAHDQTDTADGGEKTALASARRLSRMTGYEFAERDWPLWRAFARTLKQQQKNQLRLACLRQMQRKAATEDMGFVGAGVGRFLVKELAGELGLDYLDFTQLLALPADTAEIDAADCAPAVAVAYLAREVG